MSRWRIAAGLLVLVAGSAVAQTSAAPDSKDAAPASGQDTGSPFALPPPFKPKTEAQPSKQKADTPVDKSEMPPEEDKTDAPKVYSFNPVQSQSDVAIGDEYFKKGNYTAAVSRYDEATKWNDGNAVAWRNLGEALQKKSNVKAARVAYQKYLELAPDAKDASDIKKRLEKLK